MNAYHRKQCRAYALARDENAVDAIIKTQNGKYRLPVGWSYRRARGMVTIHCGEDHRHIPCDIPVMPVDLFLEADRKAITDWIDECRKLISMGRYDTDWA